MVEVRRNSAAVLAARKAVKSAAVTLRRQEVESGTATIAGVPIWIDATSQGKLTGAAIAAGLDPAMSLVWKGSDGEFYQLDAAAVITLAQGAMAFVQAAFAREGQLLAEITAAPDLDALSLIDIATGWPGQET
ncbi:prophage tail fimber assembly protein [Haematobacter massiliensis]|uniref:Prophage tail fimber assembly protein n=1 Tax=Haematobacter massiliensis TaxID=195105 RepID=A0A086Y814_9RHOB|nr:DUF4376 domain-containing protein [Haematobacter massiliensis]KFI30414.1 prophage tail fimber assembly protein [Haematobacter massiliensis]OWJ87420.1 hypothetical protein CDV51_06745 [Haematobacter massiliensis]